ncbi:MAG: GreA/GreB family elongation factor [Verrucomicrobiales bacterium]
MAKVVDAGRLPAAVGEKISLLEVGTHCLHKSWGVGKVAKWDLFGGKMDIDFEGKPGHTLGMEFAAKSLEPLAADHILSRRFDAAGDLKEMAESAPEKLVKLALRSYGGKMTLDELEDAIKGPVVPEGRYKSWWEATKKKLKADRAVVVPARRTLPLELRAEDISAGEAMVQEFLGGTDAKAKLRTLEEISRDLSAFEEPAIELQPVIDQINEFASKAIKVKPDEALSLLLARDELVGSVKELDASSGPEVSEILKTEKSRLGSAIRGLAVNRLRHVFSLFPKAFPESWADELLEFIGDPGARMVQEAAKSLIDMGKGEELTEHLKKGLIQRSLSAEALIWICKERKGSAKDVFNPELGFSVLSTLEQDQLDEGTRSNRLADLLSNDKSLISDLIEGSAVTQVRSFARRIHASPVFDDLTTKSLLARIIKIHPEVGEVVLGDEIAAPVGQDYLIVSWDSLEKKQAELDDIVKNQIPQNSKEIQIAREYGDLRENFEFKAAKQMQAVLHSRKNELEKELDNARGTDFAEVDGSKVQPGTIVTVEAPTGEKTTYTVLGAWDTDPEKHIVSYLSGVGEALRGKAVGDDATLPGEAGGRPVKVAAIEKFVK